MIFFPFILIFSIWILIIGKIEAVPLSEDEQEKIINGQNATYGNAPYMVSLGSVYKQASTKKQREAEDEKDKIDRHFCGGVLIHDQWVLAAAHCVVDGKYKQAYPASAVGVGIGTNDVVEMYELGRIPASRIIFSYKYNPQNFYTDLALIQLSIPVSKSVFATKTHSEACLGDVQSRNGQASGSLYSLGWGNTEKFSNHPKTNSWGPIQYARYLQYIPTRDVTGTDPACNGRNDMVCTFAQQQGTGVCRGDSGGPVITQSSIVIVMLSYGNPDNKGMYCNGDGRYARVGTALQWVEQNIGQQICKKIIN